MTAKRRKVLFISSWYPNRNAPTYGIFIRRHAEAAALHNDIASLYVCSEEGLEKDLEIVEANENGIPTVTVYYRKVSTVLPLYSSWLKMKRYMQGYRLGYERILKTFGKPELVHCNILFPAGLMALWLKQTFNIPYIVTENWTGYLPSDGSYKGVFLKHFTRKIANSASILTPVSKDLQRAMKGHGFEPESVIVPNVVDTTLFYPWEKKNGTGKTVIVHVSALDDKQKNISGMLRSIKKLSAKRQDFELQIIGDGNDRKKLETLAAELGIANTFVRFQGLKLREELAESFRHAGFFLLFSNYENLPCVVIEALASGLPVVATRIGGTPEHINEKLGLLVDPGDESGLVIALERMIDTHEEYDKNLLRQYALDHFSYGKVGEQLRDIYEKVLSR